MAEQEQIGSDLSTYDFVFMYAHTPLAGYAETIPFHSEYDTIFHGEYPAFEFDLQLCT